MTDSNLVEGRVDEGQDGGGIERESWSRKNLAPFHVKQKEE
jgi:hypothetical protein